jgi:hypothetical protein
MPDKASYPVPVGAKVIKAEAKISERRCVSNNAPARSWSPDSRHGAPAHFATPRAAQLDATRAPRRTQMMIE